MFVADLRLIVEGPEVMGPILKISPDQQQAIILLMGLAVIYLDGVGLGLLWPLLPYLATHYGASAIVATQLLAVPIVIGIFGGVLFGKLSDKYGRGPIIILDLFGTLAAYALLLGANSLSLVFAARIVAGFFGNRGAVVNALLTDRARGLGHVGRLSWTATMAALGSLSGTLLSGVSTRLAADPDAQYQLVIWLAIGLTSIGLALAILYMLTCEETRQTRAANPPAPLFSKRSLETAQALWAPLLCVLTNNFAWYMNAVMPLAMERRFHWSIGQTSFVLAGLSLALVIARPTIVPYLTKRIGLRGSLALFGGVGVVALIGMGLAPTALVFMIAYWAFSAVGLANIVPSALISQEANPADRGYAFGLASSAGSLGALSCAGGAGFLLEHFGEAAPFLLAAGLLATGGSVLLSVSRSKSAEAAAQKAEA